jgi:hypothetical protein
LQARIDKTEELSKLQAKLAYQAQEESLNKI